MGSYCRQVVREVYFSRIRQGCKPGGHLWEKHSRQREEHVQMLGGRLVLGVFEEKQGSL